MLKIKVFIFVNVYRLWRIFGIPAKKEHMFIKIFDPWFVKWKLYAFAKCFDTCQPARVVQADMTVNSLLSLNFPTQALVFTCLWYKSFENTLEKGEIARHEQFLLFPQCFLPFWRTFCNFHQTYNCRLQPLSVWKRLKFVVWERFKLSPYVGIILPHNSICRSTKICFMDPQSHDSLLCIIYYIMH